MNKTYEYDKAAKGTTNSGSITRSSDMMMGAKSYAVAAERICPMCNKLYKRYVGEIDYIVRIWNKNYILCSYNCKRKFMREHQKELDDMEYEKNHPTSANKSPYDKNYYVNH